MIICLMGPTGAGKTPLAVEIVKHFPCEIISVDSAMVYRGMDIGTAKPDADTLQIAPHRLINLREPNEIYSAGEFREGALREIDDIIAHKKIPLLVGGTMMYFKILQQGIAKIPRANESLRKEMQARAAMVGWPALHQELAQVDREAAERIKEQDGQRIQRALEVFYLTGKNMTAWQQDTSPLATHRIINLALMPQDRTWLHERIALRFKQMLELGFVDEVKKLSLRGDLSTDLPSIRSVGYRQLWAYLHGEYDFATACEKAMAATRQLAKRQMTWLRSWQALTLFSADHPSLQEEMFAHLHTIIRP